LGYFSSWVNWVCVCVHNVFGCKYWFKLHPWKLLNGNNYNVVYMIQQR
jgi:hypothetical protein